MALSNAHEGYEYQDLLTSYFILNEILAETNADFFIDRKEFKQDKIDDLLIVTKNHRYKKQIKYSNDTNNHTLCKSDFSTDSVYQLSIDTLYESWLKNPEKTNAEFRICLSWQPPVDELLNVLEIVSGNNTFNKFPTIVYKIDGEKLWPVNSFPLSSWRRFKSASKNIDRASFLEFCNHLIIEVKMPKLSLNLNAPGDLEILVLEQAKDLGIGIYPNEHWRRETFVLALLAIIKRSRSKGIKITTTLIFHELKIVTDYGSIEQQFPIVQEENINRKSAIEKFIADIELQDKTLLIGEPGSGKSWFIENLTNYLKSKGINVIKHFCYTKLDDPFQRDRIKLNVFYGNLISDIIKAYPELKKFKTQKYASNLSELNNLLENINEPTYLIIDGLDHIERIASFRGFSDISKQDIAIIESLSAINVSPKVKVLVTSQSITKLSLINTFRKSTLPPWNEADVKNLLKKIRIKNKKIDKKNTISKFLLNKSSGNPLYIKYLIDEIDKLENVTNSHLQLLPNYTFNLSNYYDYLLSQLNTREDVPQILAGVAFSLSRIELEEITGAGEYVMESINILSPVLKLNVSQSGYSIYHESFRRYILSHLESKSVSIENKVFKPVKDWFDSKDFYAYRKAFRYKLQFLYEGGDYERLLRILNKDFVSDSVINGHSWDAIEKNYKYFVNAACNEKDFSNIILLNELDKVISSCQADFENLFPVYFEAVGKINGFERVSEYLMFEGFPTLPFKYGIQACYICEEYNVVAPWSIYMEYFATGKSVGHDEFKYLIRGLLIIKNSKRLNRIAKKLANKYESFYCETFRNECSIFNDKEYVLQLTVNFPAVEAIINYNKINLPKTYDRIQLLQIADRILEFENIFSKEADSIQQFFDGYKTLSFDINFTNELISKFSANNWFYNWIIYYLKVIDLNRKPAFTYYDVKEAFDFLKYNVKPFLGKPRTCDLYSLHQFIYSSFEMGLKFIITKLQWKETIDTLVLVSNGTTTSLQRSISGPLSTDKLFRLLSANICEANIEYVNRTFETLSEDKQEYHLHADIAEYYFRRAAITADMSDKSKAKDFLKKGVQFSLAYTMRKDMTLVDAIEGISFYSKVNPSKALDDLKLVRILVDSAINHTDGKETQYFPNQWFKSFLKINVPKAMLFLLAELVDSRYDWRAESSLVDLLCNLDGNVNPEIETYLAISFPTNDSEPFIQYCINLFHKLKPVNPILGDKLLARIIPAVQPKKDRNLSETLVDKFNLLAEHEGLRKVYTNYKSHINPNNTQPWYEKEISDRRDFSKMSEEDLLIYFDKNEIKTTDLHSLIYIFQTAVHFSDNLKDIISLIVTKNNNNYYNKVNLDQTFADGGQIECYYWICRFVNDRGGWFQKFVNQEAFLKAHNINKELALSYLFEKLPSYLDIGFNSEFSSNILQLLIKLEYDPQKIEDLWKVLLDITSYRLPFQEDIEWESILANELLLDNEEILICMIISRYRAATTERFKWGTTAIDFLINTSPEKLIKPFKWFFANKAKFLKSAQILILQFIYLRHLTDNKFHLNFKDILLRDFPCGYFLIDYIIGKLFNRPLRTLIVNKGIIYPNIDKRLFNFFFHLNGKFKVFQSNGINLYQAFAKYSSTFNEKYHDHFELYGNRVYERVISHVHSAEHMLEILNDDFYDSFSDWSTYEDEEAFRYINFICEEALVVQANSFGRRPYDLIKPHEMKSDLTTASLFAENGWLRIAHYESELNKKAIFKITPYRAFGGITFANPAENEIPYSQYLLFPFQLWWGRDLDIEIEDQVICSILQEDSLEFLKLLWLNPRLITLMKLQTQRTQEGLVAINENKEIVMRMRTWACDYLGDRFRNSLSDEIPTLEGTDLIIREDYYKILCSYFTTEATYVTCRIPGTSF